MNRLLRLGLVQMDAILGDVRAKNALLAAARDPAPGIQKPALEALRKLERQPRSDTTPSNE